jgi:acyl carrier protein
MDIQHDLIDYIAGIANVPRQEIDPDVRIYNSVIISSLKLIELMSFIERHFSIIINPEELIEDNFKDVGTITNFIRAKLEKGGERSV